MSQYFPKPYEQFCGDINVKVDLSNYATKTDIKNISHVDTWSFALKTNLANLKIEVDKIDTDKLAPVHVDLSKLSNVAKNDIVKKTDYNVKVADIEDKIPDVSNLATKTALITVENKIPYTSGLVKKADYNAKITETKNKIPDVRNLATKTALTNVENKIPSVSELSTKTALSAAEIKIPDVNNLATKTALTTLENKIPDVSSLVKQTDYNTRLRNGCFFIYFGKYIVWWGRWFSSLFNISTSA